MNKQIILVSAICEGGYNDTLMYNAKINYFGKYKDITLEKTIEDYSGKTIWTVETDLVLNKMINKILKEQIVEIISKNPPSIFSDIEPKKYNQVIGLGKIVEEFEKYASKYNQEMEDYFFTFAQLIPSTIEDAEKGIKECAEWATPELCNIVKKYNLMKELINSNENRLNSDEEDEEEL